MHPQTLLAAITVLAMGVVPTLALPEPVAIPELLVDRAQCVGGHQKVGSGCAPARKGKTSCSADDRAVVSLRRCFDRFAHNKSYPDHLYGQWADLEDPEQMSIWLMQQQLRVHLSWWLNGREKGDGLGLSVHG